MIEQKIINCQTSVKYISASDVSLSNVSINASDILFSGKVDDIYAFIYFDQGDLPADAAQEQKQTKSYKTGKRAKGRDSLPKRIPIISREPYLRAISFQKNKDAYMRQIDDSKKLPDEKDKKEGELIQMRGVHKKFFIAMMGAAPLRNP